MAALASVRVESMVRSTVEVSEGKEISTGSTVEPVKEAYAFLPVFTLHTK
jgi:hypothetical protein